MVFVCCACLTIQNYREICDVVVPFSKFIFVYAVFFLWGRFVSKIGRGDHIDIQVISIRVRLSSKRSVQAGSRFLFYYYFNYSVWFNFFLSRDNHLAAADARTHQKLQINHVLSLLSLKFRFVLMWFFFSFIYFLFLLAFMHEKPTRTNKSTLKF